MIEEVKMKLKNWREGRSIEGRNVVFSLFFVPMHLYKTRPCAKKFHRQAKKNTKLLFVSQHIVRIKISFAVKFIAQ